MNKKEVVVWLLHFIRNCCVLFPAVGNYSTIKARRDPAPFKTINIRSFFALHLAEVKKTNLFLLPVANFPSVTPGSRIVTRNCVVGPHGNQIGILFFFFSHNYIEAVLITAGCFRSVAASAAARLWRDVFPSSNTVTFGGRELLSTLFEVVVLACCLCLIRLHFRSQKNKSNLRLMSFKW